MAEDDDDNARSLASSALGGVVGAAAGLAIGGPAGAIWGAASGPVVSGALDRLLEVRGPFRRRNVERVVGEAAAAAGMSPEALVDQVLDDPRQLLLAGAVIDAASTTVLTVKLKALAQALKEGVTAPDSPTIDREFLLVKALAELEAPHLQVLQLMAEKKPSGAAHRRFKPDPPAPPSPGASWRSYHVARLLPDVEATLTPIIGTLERHGLLERDQSEWRRAIDDAGRLSPTPSRLTWSDAPQWRVTDYGYWFLERVAQAT